LPPNAPRRRVEVLLTLFLVCAAGLLISTVLLLLLGHRLRIGAWPLGIAISVVVAVGAGQAARTIWEIPPHPVVRGEIVLVVAGSLIALTRRDWNPIGQVFFGAFVASALVYLAFGLYVTFGTNLSVPATVASFVLFLLELAGLTLATSFAFESLDVTTRVRWRRPIPDPDSDYRPFVSLQIAAYNEPPDMLIETIDSVAAIDYPNFELVVIDNNTKDAEVWQPVEEHCRNIERVTFVHVDDWPGFKAGALNLVLREHTDPRTEVVGVIDADYRVDPAYLSSLVGYFADPTVAYVQSPQDYREWEGDAYLTACYDAYRYFFTTTMPSRNERNSIIFAGTMGLLRRAVLERLGGWDEWCITEDAETSLRILKEGYSGIYVAKSFGQGIMPLTFGSFKSQRFRWCFGGMQILRQHWRELMPWKASQKNRLTLPQRIDYLLGGVQWLNDLIYLGFTAVLLGSAVVLSTKGHLGLRPLIGAAAVLPVALIASGLLRAAWALRERTGIGVKRSLLAFANWLSVSWTVALACAQGLVRRRGVFMRTPKSAERRDALSALWTTRAETSIAVALWGAGALTAAAGRATPFLLVLFAWQGSVYATAPMMSLLSTRTTLSPELERRRATEWMRDRFGQVGPYLVGAAATVGVVMLLGALIGVGGSNPGPRAENPFVLPTKRHHAPAVSRSVVPTTVAPAPVPTTVSPTPTPTPSASTTPSPTASPTPSPTAAPS
jgi:cellulose synthase/poly-beta-1,6-N-acetylglucosamine synthase-like glycosyltransferase